VLPLSLFARDFDVQHTAAGLGKEMVGGGNIPSQLVKKCIQYVLRLLLLKFLGI